MTSLKSKVIEVITILPLLLGITNSFLLSPPTTITTKQTVTTKPLLYSSSDSGDNTFQKDTRWSSLTPNVKKRIIEEAQQRAIRNKKKREPAATKKRRLMMHYKKAQLKAKKSSRVMRPLPLHSKDRIALSDLIVDDIYNGTVISLTDFGAYVDIGSDCDGLLHVSQITREEFVEHPRQVLTPGMEVDVRLVRKSPELKKMQLSMLPSDILQDEVEDEEAKGERIALSELAVDDELWGEIKRVTAFGAYVELGAAVQGWLHFMDHPLFGNVPGARPKEFMSVGERIRCWVSNVDPELQRIKLTANRPEDLPGPRREIRKTVDDSEYY
jgi:transcriptional accessory protein Tex/SPT6